MPNPPRPPAPRPSAPRYVLDGRRTTSLAAFYAEVGRAVVGRADWGASADGLDALLRDAAGGSVDPAARVRLVWAHAAAARAALGYPETVRQRTAELRDCPPNVLIRTAWALRAALRGTGPTLFDALVLQLEAHPNVRLARHEGAAREGAAAGAPPGA